MFYTLKTWVFDQSECAQGSIYILNTKARYKRALAPPPNFEFTTKNQDGGQ